MELNKGSVFSPCLWGLCGKVYTTEYRPQGGKVDTGRSCEITSVRLDGAQDRVRFLSVPMGTLELSLHNGIQASRLPGPDPARDPLLFPLLHGKKHSPHPSLGQLVTEYVAERAPVQTPGRGVLST